MSMMEDTSIEEIINRPIVRGVPIVYKLDDEMKFISKEELSDE